MYSFWCVGNIALLTSRNITTHQNSYIYFHIKPITYNSWIKIKENLNKDNVTVAKQQNVTENRSTIFYKDWFDRGIQCFKHLKYKYVTYNLCELCKCFEQTIEHVIFFWECQITQNLLSNLNIFLANKNKNMTRYSVWNFFKQSILMHVQLLDYYYEQYFLYAMKIPLNFQRDLKYLKHRIQIKKLIVKKNNQLKFETHSKEYEILVNTFT